MRYLYCRMYSVQSYRYNAKVIVSPEAASRIASRDAVAQVDTLTVAAAAGETELEAPAIAASGSIRNSITRIPGRIITNAFR